jgi:mono/diheme cytochrome c family protein
VIQLLAVQIGGRLATRRASRVGLEALWEKTLKPWHLLCLALGLTACQQLPSTGGSVLAAASPGHAFAQASCSGCHAVERYGASPNPDAPTFAAVANQAGLTAQTLTFWLGDAHNYPQEMEFTLGSREVDDLVAYMLTLRDPDYRPPP